MSVTLRKDQLCGLTKWHPPWLQRYANTKMFMAVYGLLGTIQAMSYMYFIVTLTTIEKRFKIPSQTTGIILSGNEISQIMLSLILSYVGGQRNRPRWIAWGIVFCGLSCYIIALPHFIYGAGDDMLQLTQEYLDDLGNGNSSLLLFNVTSDSSQHLCKTSEKNYDCDDLVTIVPLILIFLSQFVLGIGNTLYYSLGQTYLDDNTKKTNTPLMLAMAMVLRMIGPIVGFFLGYVSLNMFVDTSKTPLIDRKDPRWLGAWWFGWIILGTFMLLFSGLIGMFPKQLPKKKPDRFHSEMPKVLRVDEIIKEEGVPLSRGFSSNQALDQVVANKLDFPTLKDFPRALVRLLKNKLLIFNIISAIFYILGAAGYMTFLTKYMEVQFQKNSQNATIIIGPLTIIGMVAGLMTSGFIITKKKPSPSKVLFWNVIVGAIYIVGQFSYLFMHCGDTTSMLADGKLNILMPCNSNCSCEGVAFNPVCHAESDTTYFSPCHAGCNTWNAENKTYSDCSCIAETPSNSHFTTTISPVQNHSDTQPSTLAHLFSTENPDLFLHSTTVHSLSDQSRSKRSVDESFPNILTPGTCLKGCMSFWAFSTVSMIINWFGSSGRVGNVLVNYRAVSNEDKSFAQGLTLMLVSLFALIPGPILFGWIIDSTCIVWTEKCGTSGNCQLYDQTRFRHYVNTAAIVLTFFGVIFDILVWHYGKNLDLYGQEETKRLEEIKRKNTAISPLLSRRTNNS